MAEADEKRILKIRRCVVKEIQGEALNAGVGEPMPPEPPTYDFTYTVTFDANGGWTGNSKVQVSGNEGDDIYLSFLPIAKRRHYVFDGWFTQKDGGTQIVDPKQMTIQEDTTIYAHWTQEYWSIQYNMNGHGEVPDGASTAYCADDLPGYAPPRPLDEDGWTFVGWIPEKIPDGFYGDVLFSAIWKPGKAQMVDVTFYGNGGTPEKTTVHLAKNGRITHLPVPDDREGYEFCGWICQKDGRMFQLDEDTIIASNLVCYAQWNVKPDEEPDSSESEIISSYSDLLLDDEP